MVGTVTGTPALVTERRELLGRQVLMVTLTFAVTMSLAFLLAAGPGGLGLLLAPIIAVTLLVVAHRAFVKGRARRRRPGVVTRAKKPAAHDLPARRFQLTLVAGGLVDCVLYGDSQSHDLRHGDIVRVTARRNRTGNYVVHRVEVLATPTGPVVRQVAAGSSMRLRVAQLASRMYLVLAGLIVLWVAAVLIAKSL